MKYTTPIPLYEIYNPPIIRKKIYYFIFLIFMKTSYHLTSISKFTYSLTIHGEYADVLYKVIQPMLDTSYITNNILFTAEHVMSLKESQLSHHSCIKIIDDLSKQLFYLNKLGYGFYGIDVDNILIIDKTFIFCSVQYLLPLDNNDILFVSPINIPTFSNPELDKLTSLPYKINTKCFYYSLGALITFLLLNKNLLVGNSEQIDIILHPIINTKIYWFLKRCLHNNIDNRQLLLI